MLPSYFSKGLGALGYASLNMDPQWFLSSLRSYSADYFRSAGSLSDEDGVMSGIRDAFYHKTRRNTIILLYNQDILILDMGIKQTVSAVSLDRSTSPFVQVRAV